MNILDVAIKAEAGNISQLARALEISPSTITNWKRRGGIPHMATRAIKAIYAKQISAAIKEEKAALALANSAPPATENVASADPCYFDAKGEEDRLRLSKA